MEQTLSIIKPDAVAKGVIGKIIDRFESNGLKIAAMKKIKLSHDEAGKFYGIHNMIFLKDILENEVDEKYYLSDKQINKLKEYLGKKNKINEEVINCVGTCFGRSGSSKEELENFSRTNKALMIGNLSRYKMKSERSIEFKEEGVSRGLTGNCSVGIIIKSIPKILDLYNKKVKEDICPTLTDPKHNNLRLLFNLRIRKLIPIECFRLMGFLNDEINLEGLSDTQRYKLAGNGWDINLVSKIFKKMFLF